MQILDERPESSKISVKHHLRLSKSNLPPGPQGYGGGGGGGAGALAGGGPGGGGGGEPLQMGGPVISTKNFQPHDA